MGAPRAPAPPPRLIIEPRSYRTLASPLRRPRRAGAAPSARGCRAQIRAARSGKFRTLLVDPPRAGLDEDSLALAGKFEQVLYVSCNPARLRAELPQLKHHRVVAAALFDQFPWTRHAEVGLHLARS